MCQAEIFIGFVKATYGIRMLRPIGANPPPRNTDFFFSGTFFFPCIRNQYIEQIPSRITQPSLNKPLITARERSYVGHHIVNIAAVHTK